MSAEPVDNSLVQPDNEIAVSKIDNPEMVPGRRDFLKYRELGVPGGRLCQRAGGAVLHQRVETQPRRPHVRPV